MLGMNRVARRWVTVVLVLWAAALSTSAQGLILPVAGDPGPETWVFGQAYGNTTMAFDYGDFWYTGGQGLHFGLDLSMPCGTPLLAAASGTVLAVDNLARGAGPHNIILHHPNQGILTLYGHLNERSFLHAGASVKQGDVIGYSGDADGSACNSRPHLHFEVRLSDYSIAYNPVDFIDVYWHMLMSASGYDAPHFTQDLNNARRWLSIDDQPDVVFSGIVLNAYAVSWPPGIRTAPPPNPPLLRTLDVLPPEVVWTARQLISDPACCWYFGWDTTDPAQFWVIDGASGARASIFSGLVTTGGALVNNGIAPPPLTSPDGVYTVSGTTGGITLTGNGQTLNVAPLGAAPALSPDNSKLTWTVRAAVPYPGNVHPFASVWVSNLDGSNRQQVASQRGVSGQWLDSDRLLLITRGYGNAQTLAVYDTRDGSTLTLGTWFHLERLTVSPGGKYLMFDLFWQGDSPGGVYALQTESGAQPELMPWFGGWRWRDSRSVFYLPLDANTPYHTLAYYDLETGADRVLLSPETQPFTIMNGDWEISADGRRILFRNALDRTLWVLEMMG